jgi:ornithine carbamoyltransferase
MTKDLLAITDLSSDQIGELLNDALEIKIRLKKEQDYRPLSGKTLILIFQKPSNRTRVSFQVGMYQLGGEVVYLSPNDIQLGKRELVSDVARTLSRYGDGIMARLFGHEMILELARYATVPVINGLTDLLHPCQVLADLLTIREWRKHLEGTRVAFVGDGNNVANSWLKAAARLPLDLRMATPPGYEPDEDILQEARDAGISTILMTNDPADAVREAEVIYADVWASMGQEAEAERRMRDFQGFQVDQALVDRADKGVKVMHCLPAHRGQEISDEVIEGPHSVVFDQAENRMHIQKAVLVKLMG